VSRSNLIKKLLSRFLQEGHFVRSVSLLVGGTAVSQLIVVLSLPILTRLYTPNDFSLLAVYTSITGLIGVVACLRFHLAVTLPESDETAMDLLRLALLSALVLSSMIGIAVVSYPSEIADLISQPTMAGVLWMVPLGVLFGSAYDALQYWATRRRQFGLVARTRVSRSLGGVGVQLGAGLYNSTSSGLLFGQLIYGGLGTLGLFASVWRVDRGLLVRFDADRIFRTAREYSRYPKLSVPEALANTAGSDVPVLLIASAAIGPEAGYLMLALRVMGMPMVLVGSSVSQVFFAESASKYRDGQLAEFTYSTMRQLLLAGAPVVILAALLSPMVFPMVFGLGWERAGTLMAWLAPAMLLQFVASPVSLVLHTIGRLRIALLLQVIGSVIRVGVVYLASQVAPQYMSESFACVSAFFYGMYILVVVSMVRGR
jgi:O-antigen/teichoic acid export membrane protein